MNNKDQSHLNTKWYRLGLALLLALVLLFIPVTARSFIRFYGFPQFQPEPQAQGLSSYLSQASGQLIDLSLPFGVALVRASNGLTVTKFAPVEVDQGGVLTYTVVVTNDTGSVITNGLVVDVLPAEVDCDPSGNPDPSSDWLSFNCGNDPAPGFALFQVSPPSSPFANGTAVELIYTVDVSQPLTDGHTIINSTYFMTSTTFPQPVFGPPVTTSVKAPQWAITKTVSANTIQPNQILVYTITVSNIGHLDTSGNYVISDTLPNDTTLVSAPGATGSSTLNWTFNTPLAALTGSRSVTYSVQVNSPLSTGTEIINDDYTVSGGNAYAAATGAPVVITVDSPADLSVTKTASADPVKIGQIFTYTLTITNTSLSGQATGVVLTDTLPDEVIYQSAGFMSGPPGTITATGGNPIVWSFNNPLGPGASAQVTVTVRVKDNILLPDPAVITNNFEASASNAVPISGVMAVGIGPGDPDSLTVTAGSTSLEICETTSVTTVVFDNGGNPVPNAPVELQVLDSPPSPSATLSPDSGTTDQNGTFTSTLKAVNGAANIRILGVSGAIDNLPPVQTISISSVKIPDQLVLNVAPNPLYTGGKTGVVTATLTCLGDPVAGELVTFDLSDMSLASFPGPSDSDSDTTGANGQAAATLTSTSTETANGTVIITGTSGALQDVITLDVQPELKPALTISKTASPAGGSNVLPGSAIDYTITVANTGDGNAANVVLTDTLPASVGFVSINSSTTGSGSIGSPTFPASNVLVLPLSLLEPNQTLAATIRVTVTAGVSGTVLSNVANAKSNTTPVITSNIVIHNVITQTTAANKTYLPIVLK